MPLLTVLLTVLLVVAVALCALLAYRLGQLRSAGTPVLLREVPAGADEGWRHGTVHYSDEALRYFRLSSLRPGPSATFCRQGIEITGRRDPVGTETDIMDGLVVLQMREAVTAGRPDHQAGPGTYELAMTPGAVTAFQSWLESRQSDRSQRRRSA
ncbi:Protein of unknown function DUF2550 [Gordonia bronchialis DSM 43247]|uniref:Secreted/membrane protein n=1 Tax=Gordonia bronchialis (strain ATCC 25592 / DSM 43247 / BCRC 13721 / JCM 3198 / KCTC 3076 / NBRC 16047 / NCTC 10667) TaxID=526226 RepID=D0L9I9_GORB4|nr:DUF2550 domain-containing protein [Gordonia bronchialis]ACY21177.1 Protein of unknown function DUF2550 [Gordonia bronchialis DSM 43247]MCC3323960.1 DUF2550 domain-containing protein [Gordonia bronchialis]QGS25132.1 DUF2550 family protein [Gordonia bronchialis]UAK38592.1 DUF2550 domain-containing protein [Gordonia bronchialis]STQ64048.1 Protein of uncharacterised function (DUF2550) [Gordonia bronchialis]